MRAAKKRRLRIAILGFGHVGQRFVQQAAGNALPPEGRHHRQIQHFHLVGHETAQEKSHHSILVVIFGEEKHSVLGRQKADVVIFAPSPRLRGLPLHPQDGRDVPEGSVTDSYFSFHKSSASERRT